MTEPNLDIQHMTRRARRRHKRMMHHVHMQRLGWHKQWKNWRYKNTTLLVLSMILFLLLATTAFTQELISSLGTTGYIGAYFAGVFLVSVFTAAPASVVLYNLAGMLHPVEIALLAGLGSVTGDYIIFRYVKDTVFEELEPLFEKFTTHKLTKLFYTPYFVWLTPILGMLFIASPGPDEVGIGLLGLSKIKKWQFLLVTFMLNFTGILLIVLLARS